MTGPYLVQSLSTVHQNHCRPSRATALGFRSLCQNVACGCYDQYWVKLAELGVEERIMATLYCEERPVLRDLRAEIDLRNGALVKGLGDMLVAFI